MSTEPAQQSRRRGRRGAWTLVLALVAAVLIYNLSVLAPAASATAKDDRNAGMGIYTYRSWLVSPTGITVDLMGDPTHKAPLDLFRGLMQSAAALKSRHFGVVSLARRGKVMFRMRGADFQELGQAYDAGENPVYLIRTLPEKLLRPDGTAAFGTWEGGMLGVLGKQMQDATNFGAQWATGDQKATVGE